MNKAAVFASLSAFGLSVMLAGPQCAAAAPAVQGSSVFVRIVGEPTDKIVPGAIEVSFLSSSTAPTSARFPTTKQSVKCGEIVVSIAMADGSVMPARYDADSVGGCRYSAALTAAASGRIKVRFPTLPGDIAWPTEESASLVLTPGGTAAVKVSASHGSLTYAWSLQAPPSR